MEPAAFLFLGANTPWVYALAAALAASHHPTTGIAAYDFLTYHRGRPQWPDGEPPALLQREWWVWPPGYVGRLDRVFAPILRWRLGHSLSRLSIGRGHAPTASPWTVVPYPWFVQVVQGISSHRLIYYNLDDYALYNPRRKEKIDRQEADMVRRASLSLCLSQEQCDRLRSRFPARAEFIRHFPLGVVDSYLNPEPQNASVAATVGYVGNLIDRVDWLLVAEVARLLPDVEFQFVGGLDGFGGGGVWPDWQRERDVALALPNVRRIGPIPQDEVSAYYWNFGVTWIPYATDHAFNQAACPTKIMDGIASGRPVISTDLPECRLYPEWITIVESAPAAAAEAIRRLLVDPPSSERAHAQVAFARLHTWAERAKTLSRWVEHEDQQIVDLA